MSNNSGLAALREVAARVGQPQVWYVACPLRPSEEEIRAQEEGDPIVGSMDREHAVRTATRSNCFRAMRWLRWLGHAFPTITFIAPWVAAVLAGEDDADEAQREHGLRDDCRVVERCDGIVVCGGRVSSGMQREATHARRHADITDLGAEPPRV